MLEIPKTLNLKYRFKIQKKKRQAVKANALEITDIHTSKVQSSLSNVNVII